MSITPKQIGWSEKANLLWEISRQLDRINSVVCTGPCPTTTTTTTILSTTTTTTTLASCVEVSFEVTENCGDQDYATVEYTDCDGVLQTVNAPSGPSTLKVCTLAGATPPVFICGDGDILTGSACSITTTTTTTCNCREVIEVVEYPLNFYTCLGEYIECPTSEGCVSPIFNCIDISQPYTGVTPSETITGTCNCNPA